MAKLLSDLIISDLASATLTFYESGTTTPLDTYMDNALLIANANPVVADANGRFPPIYLKDDEYKAVLKNSAGATLATVDPIHGNEISTGANNSFTGANTFSGAVTLSSTVTVSGDTTVTGELNADGPLATGPGTELTIASGSITPTGNDHTVDTESDAATDDLDTIATGNMQDGAILLLTPANVARVVTVKGDSSGNITLHGNRDFELDSADAFLLLRLDTAEWREIASGPRNDLRASQSATGTEVDFVGINPDAQKITVMFEGVSNNGTNVPRVQLGDSGGFETTGYSGTYGHVDATPTMALIGAGTGFLLTDNWAGSVVFHGRVTLMRQTGNTWVCEGSIGHSSAAVLGFVNGSKSLSGELTQIRITADGVDTFDAGNISIYVEYQ